MDSNYDAWEPWDTESETPIEETLVFDDLSAMLYDMVRNDIARFQPLILASNNHTLAIRKDGTVIATGDNEYGQCDVSDWKDIVAISSNTKHSVGLKKDGTVVAASSERYATWDIAPDGSYIQAECPQCIVSDWKDIVAVSAGYEHTVGVKKDGSVIAVGDNYYFQCDINDWKDVVRVSAGSDYTLALKSDGTVFLTHDKLSDNIVYCLEPGFLPFPKFYEFDIRRWKNIIDISSSNTTALGIRKNGTVAAQGWVWRDMCAHWRNIVAVSAGYKHSVGLKADGTVVAAGNNEYGQCDVSDWKDIVAVSAGNNHTVGIKKDGTVVATGDNQYGQCNVSNWKLF